MPIHFNVLVRILVLQLILARSLKQTQPDKYEADNGSCRPFATMTTCRTTTPYRFHHAATQKLTISHAINVINAGRIQAYNLCYKFIAIDHVRSV